MKQKNTPRKTDVIDSSSKLLLLIENTKEYAFILLDSQGRVDDWNKGAQKLLGYRESEIIGKNFSKFFIPEDRQAKRSEKELEKAVTQGHADDENWIVRKDGSRFWASGLTTPIRDKIGNLIGFAKVVRDLTERRELDQEQQDFITIATHELRTPFTVAKLLRGALQKHLEEQDDKKGLMYFNKITHALDQLDSLLRDLLNVSKMQTGKVDYDQERFKMEDLVQEVVGEIQQTTEHKIQIKGKSSIEITAYRPQITEVITNFLTNAIKYSPGKKKIIVTIKGTKKYVQVSVHDFGIGISKRNIKNLFSRFYRTPISQEKQIPGIGLGLYISKKIIEGHNGQIYATSTLGKGSTFTFVIPIETKH